MTTARISFYIVTVSPGPSVTEHRPAEGWWHLTFSDPDARVRYAKALGADDSDLQALATNPSMDFRFAIPPTPDHANGLIFFSTPYRLDLDIQIHD